VVFACVAVALSLYGWFLARHMGAVAGGADSSGYFNQARALSGLETHVPVRELPGLSLQQAPTDYLYVPLGFRPSKDKEALAMTYPIGLPLLIAAAASVVGWVHAGGVVMWLHAMGALFVVYALGRSLDLARTWAALGAAIVAVSAVYVCMALQAMSDVPSLTWVTSAVLAAWKSRRASTAGRGAALAAGAGAAFALAVLIRPTNSLALIPLLIALGFSWRRMLAFGLAGLPGAALLAWHNHAAYGAVFSSGYGNIAGIMSWAIVPRTLLHYATWLPVLFGPQVLLVPLLPFVGGRFRRAEAWVLVTWATLFLGFFVAYYHTHETWWYLRFVLPMMPAGVFGGLLVLDAWSRRFGARAKRRFVLAAAVVSIGVPLHWTDRLNAEESGYGERVYPEMVEWVRDNVPPDGVIVCMQASGALYFSTGYTIVRWDVIPPDRMNEVVVHLDTSGLPVFAVLWAFEYPRALEALGGEWVEAGRVRDVTMWRRVTPTEDVP
jgi:hypothetical protein